MNDEEINKRIKDLYIKFTRKYQIDLRNPTMEEFLEYIEFLLNLKEKAG